MARSGPKPAPPALQLIGGEKRPSRRREGVELPPVAPDEPRWTDVFPGRARGIGKVRADAARAWATIVPSLDRLGLLATVDFAALEEVCICHARIRECERLIAEDGILTDGRKGTVRNAATTVAHQYRTQLRSLIGELGLSPSSRGRIPGIPLGGIGGEGGSGDDLLDDVRG